MPMWDAAGMENLKWRSTQDGVNVDLEVITDSGIEGWPETTVMISVSGAVYGKGVVYGSFETGMGSLLGFVDFFGEGDENPRKMPVGVREPQEIPDRIFAWLADPGITL